MKPEEEEDGGEEVTNDVTTDTEEVSAEPELVDDTNEAIDGKIAKLKEEGITDEEDEEEVVVTDDADSVEINTVLDEPTEEEPSDEEGAGFNGYMKDRGYDPENAGSSSEEEIGSVISGWANDNADDESQHKTIAIYLTPAIQKYLTDSGHGEFLEKLLPILSGMGEDQVVKFGSNEVAPQEDNVDNTIEPEATPEKQDITFAPAGQTLDAGIAKRSSAPEEKPEEEPTASNVDDEETEEEEVETEEVSESTKMLKKYIQVKLDEKMGKRKSVLKEGKKSPTAVLVERILDEEINRLKKKLTESHQVSEQEIDEISLGGLFNVGKTAGNMAKGVVDSVVSAVEQKIVAATNTIKDAGDTLVKSYHAGAKNAVLDDIEKMAAELGQLISKVNASAVKAGEQPINVKSILATIQNQLASSKGLVSPKPQGAQPIGKGGKPSPVNLSKFKTK